MASNTGLSTAAGTKHNGGVNDAIQRGLPQYLLPQCETSLLIFLTNPVAWVDSIEFVSVTMNFSINVPMEQSPSEWIKSLCDLVPFAPTVCCVLTASGCARPRCHVIAICTQDWLTSGRVAMISSMVASLSSGGGCLMVQGVLGTQAHQSNWKAWQLVSVSVTLSGPPPGCKCVSPAPVHCLSRHAGPCQWRWLQTRQCRVPLWCWDPAVNLDAHEPHESTWHGFNCLQQNEMASRSVLYINSIYIYIYIKVDVFFPEWSNTY